MSFHNSAQDISLDGTTLRANLANVDGEWVEAELELNDVLGNNEGAFEWGSGGFSEAASDVEFAIEGDDDPVPVLRAVLRNSEDEEVAAEVNLAERIGNNNGSFHFE